MHRSKQEVTQVVPFVEMVEKDEGVHIYLNTKVFEV